MHMSVTRPQLGMSNIKTTSDIIKNIFNIQDTALKAVTQDIQSTALVWQTLELIHPQKACAEYIVSNIPNK